MSDFAPRRDRTPYLLVPVLAALMLAAMPLPVWIALTVAGVATGTMLFLMAAGLTLIFGLMDVLNFAHGGFITLGAYLAVTVLAALPEPVAADNAWLNLAALAAALLAAAAGAGAMGWAFERLLLRRLQGAPLRQILVTTGGLIVIGQLVLVLWGPQPLPLAKPLLLRGGIVVAGATVETARLAAVAVGLAVFAAMQLALSRTRIGLLVRAGVENRELVEALGYRIDRLFVAVFVAGSALAGLGGAMWAIYQELVTADIGTEMTRLVFIVVIIGGLGSVAGSFIAALLVGLAANYAGFLVPRLALGSDLALLAAVLLWRPRGLLPLARP